MGCGWRTSKKWWFRAHNRILWSLAWADSWDPFVWAEILSEDNGHLCYSSWLRPHSQNNKAVFCQGAEQDALCSSRTYGRRVDLWAIRCWQATYGADHVGSSIGRKDCKKWCECCEELSFGSGNAFIRAYRFGLSGSGRGSCRKSHSNDDGGLVKAIGSIPDGWWQRGSSGCRQNYCWDCQGKSWNGICKISCYSR